uniref:Kinesin-like KIF1-type domain-containing protein n=1 Tax=Strombidium rassoulzadegani TaxID=1082188 RepID=A0A7S3FVJ3_9SPIT|mmetsp:Transcript_11751/g.19831  ORF Transcript_11751/g.19831 Transcript_11751/m.19831 type:complete len:380 (+) Transcript_11751:2018-3157(+)
MQLRVEANERHMETERIKNELERERQNQQVEYDTLKRQMEAEKERYEKKMQEQKQAYEKKMRNDNQIKFTKQKMKNIKKQVDEANEIARSMGKHIVFTAIYISKFDNQSIYANGSSSAEVGEMKTEIEIKVENFELDQINQWTCDKFNDKLVMMRDAYQIYEERAEVVNSSQEDQEDQEDPFSEKAEPVLLGQAFYLLEGLAYQVADDRQLPIVTTTNEINGQLHINVVPCEENGNEELDEDMLPEDPMEMLDRPLDFKVKISHISGLPEDFCTNIFCEYKFYIYEDVYRTPVCEGRNLSPQFDFVQQHHFDPITKQMVQYLQDDKLTVKIYGNQNLNKKGKQPPNFAKRHSVMAPQHNSSMMSKSTASSVLDPLRQMK